MGARVIPLHQGDDFDRSLEIAKRLDEVMAEWDRERRASPDLGEARRRLEARIQAGPLVVTSGPRKGKPLGKSGRRQFVMRLSAATCAWHESRRRVAELLDRLEDLCDQLEAAQGHPVRERPWRRGLDWSLHRRESRGGGQR